MRLALALLVLLSTATPASAARLFGNDLKRGGFHFVTPELKPDRRPVSAGPRPAATAASPDGKRVAVLAPHRVYILGPNGRRRDTLPSDAGSQVFWPDRNHVVVVGFDVVASYDLARGKTRRVRLDGEAITDAVRDGTRLRLLLRDQTGGSGIAVMDVSAAGRVVARHEVALPETMADDLGIGAQLERRLLLLSGQDGYAVARPGEDPVAIDLPGDGGLYDLYRNGLASDGRHVARIDPSKLTVTRSVDTGLNAARITPYRNGFIAGFGAKRYDESFRLADENPDPVEIANDGRRPLLFRGRLYGRLPNCEPGQAGGLVIVDANTGTELNRRPGVHAVGRFGGGDVLYSHTVDDCD